MPNFPKKLAIKIADRASKNMLRKLDGCQNLIDLSSNDYLGFSRNQRLAKKALEILESDSHFKNGSTGSRLLTGNHVLYEKLEAYLAEYHNTGAALVFNSGYDANLGFFSSVPQRNDIIFYDELCHASIRDGITLGNAKSYKFKHNDLNDLVEKILSVRAQSRTKGSEIYVVTESVFSMHGDSPDLRALARICDEHELYFVVDEAHAVGVFGKGRVNELKLESSIFARIITFGKAIGVHGAAILCSDELKQYLINFSRSFIYTTGQSPHTIAAILASYQELQSENGAKSMIRLRENINFFTREIENNGLGTYFRGSTSAIQICELGGNENVKKLSQVLRIKGFDVRPILTPTVPKKKERLRLCIHAFNTTNEMKEVLQIIKDNI